MNNCIESESIPPAAREVGDTNSGIALSRSLSPSQQSLFERQTVIMLYDV
jgi:hypothetical protein